MIRPAMPDDSAVLIALVVATELFLANETKTLDKMLEDYFCGKSDDGHMCIIDDEDEPRGVA